MKRSFITGFICGGIICAAVTGFAVEYAVTANPFPVKVNGTEKVIEGYNINDNTYFKLRDVADAVGGFEVGFADNTITIDTAGATPEQPDAPTSTTAPVDLSAAIIKGDNGKNYTMDGLEIIYVDNVGYVSMYEIQQRLNDKGLSNYTFGTDCLINKETWTKVITDIPICESNSALIQLNFYISNLLPFINNL